MRVRPIACILFCALFSAIAAENALKTPASLIPFSDVTATPSALWPKDKTITRTFVSHQRQEITGPHERIPRLSEFRQEQTAVLETSERADRKSGRDARLSFSGIRLKISQEGEETLELDSERVEDRVHPAMEGWRTIKDVKLAYRQDASVLDALPQWSLVHMSGFPGSRPPPQVTDPALYQPFLSPSIIPSFPTEPLQQGVTWTEDRALPLPGVGAIQAHLKYTVMGLAETNGFPVVNIQVRGTLLAPTQASTQQRMKFIKGSMDGIVLYSSDWGLDIYHSLTQVMEFETPHPVVGGVVKTRSTLTHSMSWLGMQDREGFLLQKR